ncbi:hypothetical protein F5Y15DRAFT_142331 [Xylariaceae sp. FL0016]|nr:hypothetical protein F5Y15DRAFT_142331 [Xylariaceae sp. FL0016]
MSARLLLSRLRPLGLGAGLGACVLLQQSRARPLRFDAPRTARETPTAAAATPPSSSEATRGGLSEAMLRQISGGSLTGFVSGLLISVFSKTLVLLFGISVILVQVASRNGIDLLQHLKLRQRLGNSKILAALEKDPAFKLSFGLFFAMSAFMRF